MPFDQNGNFVRVHSWQADKAAGLYAEASRFDEEMDDAAQALSNLKQGLNAVTTPPTLTQFYTKSEINALLTDKQEQLGFTPLNASARGQANGVASLGSDGKVPASQLPTINGSTVFGVESLNGRTGVVSVEQGDISNALGYVPARETHAHVVSDVSGLQSALDAKQQRLTYVPANEVHSHVIADVTDLQSALDALTADKAGFSNSTDANTTTFPVGQLLIVNTPAAASARSGISVYRHSGYYDSRATVGFSTGVLLTGAWVVCGRIVDEDGTQTFYSALAQRVA